MLLAHGVHSTASEDGPRGALRGQSLERMNANSDHTAAPQVECISTPARLRARATAWQELLNRDPHATAYQSIPWLLTWMARHPSATPAVLIARRGEAVTAALPLCAYPLRFPGRKIHVIRFLADNDCDYCTALSNPEFPEDLSSLWNAVLECRAWSLIDLRYVTGESPLVTLAAAPRSGFLVDRQQQDTAPFLDIRVDWRHSVSSNHRSQVLRRLRQLRAEGTVTFDVARTPGEVSEMLQQLSAMHIARWRRRRETSIFAVPEDRDWLHAATHALHQQGLLYLCRLSLNGTPISIGLYCLARRRLTNYMVSFDEEYRRFGPVHLMVMMAIDDARARNLADIHDFGRGSEEYKLRWTRAAQPVSRILVARSSPTGRAAFWWATRAQPFIWEHYAAATFLREIRRRLRMRRSASEEAGQ
jgi:CelD/BcsL family acetyltransferase involved in cellulose biosynthesis